MEITDRSFFVEHYVLFELVLSTAVSVHNPEFMLSVPGNRAPLIHSPSGLKAGILSPRKGPGFGSCVYPSLLLRSQPPTPVRMEMRVKTRMVVRRGALCRGNDIWDGVSSKGILTVLGAASGPGRRNTKPRALMKTRRANRFHQLNIWS